MKLPIAFLIVILMILSASLLIAQNTIGLEVRGGASIATTDLGDADLKTGIGFEALVDYRFLPAMGIYAGWGWNRFAADESFAGPDRDFEETGYQFGLSMRLPAESSLGLYARAGAIYNHIEVENGSGDIIADSGHGFGFSLQAGLDIQLRNSWYIRPGIKYQELSRELTLENITTPVDLRYLNLGVGLVKQF